MRTRREWLNLISAACFTAAAIFIIGVTAYEMMLPEKEHEFTYTVKSGDTAWSIADKHYKASPTMCFDEFRHIVADQIAEQTGSDLKSLQAGQTVKVVWKDKY